MRVRCMAILVLTAAASFGVPAFAHHSQSMFDTTKEILVQGTVARFDWKNPHMYLIVETKGPKGEKVLVEGEGLVITQALVDGLRREALMPFLWTHIARHGQIFGDPSHYARAKLTNGKKFSYPGYHEILCGFPDDRIDSNDPVPNPNVNVLEWLNGRPGFQGRVKGRRTADLSATMVTLARMVWRTRAEKCA